MGRSRVKHGDIGRLLLVQSLRQEYAALLEKQQAEREAAEALIHQAVRDSRDSGASLTALCEVYGTSDRTTIINICRDR